MCVAAWLCARQLCCTSWRSRHVKTLAWQWCKEKARLLGRITTLVLCRQSPLNLHQFRLTKDSKYGLLGTDWNAIWQYFASIRLYLALLFIMSIHTKILTLFVASIGSRWQRCRCRQYWFLSYRYWFLRWRWYWFLRRTKYNWRMVYFHMFSISFGCIEFALTDIAS